MSKEARMGAMSQIERQPLRVAAIYARVSSERQREGGTIESQVAGLHELAQARGLVVPEQLVFLDEGFSGAMLLRPALERLRDRAAEGCFEVLLCHCPDRLARRYAYQVLLLEELDRAGVEVVFLREGERSGSPEDELLRQFQGMIAEYERAQIRERTRRGKLYRARQGSQAVLVCAPFGYRYLRKTDDADGYFQVDPAEAEVVREVFRRYSEGTSRSPRSRGRCRRAVSRPGPARPSGTARRCGGCCATPPTAGRPRSARHRPAASVPSRRVRRAPAASATAGERHDATSRPRTGRSCRCRRSSASRPSSSRRRGCRRTNASPRATPSSRRCCKGSSSAASAATPATAPRRAPAAAGSTTTAASAPTTTATSAAASVNRARSAQTSSTTSSGQRSGTCSNSPSSCEPRSSADSKPSAANTPPPAAARDSNASSRACAPAPRA